MSPPPHTKMLVIKEIGLNIQNKKTGKIKNNNICFLEMTKFVLQCYFRFTCFNQNLNEVTTEIPNLNYLRFFFFSTRTHGPISKKLFQTQKTTEQIFPVRTQNRKLAQL